MSGFAYDREREAMTRTDIPAFKVGDTVDVHVRIVEAGKERIQVFTGAVIARKHQGLRETFTVRRIVAGEGVERIFPIHSPKVEKIVVQRHGEVRKAKLYFMRKRIGNATRIAEDLRRDRDGNAPAAAPHAKAGEAHAEEKPAEEVVAAK